MAETEEYDVCLWWVCGEAKLRCRCCRLSMIHNTTHNWIINHHGSGICPVHSARILRCFARLATKRARQGVLTAFMTTKVGRANIIPAYRAILRELYKSVRIHRHPCFRSSLPLCVLVNQPKVYAKSDNCSKLPGDS